MSCIIFEWPLIIKENLAKAFEEKTTLELFSEII
jgi:hypothetical protein